MAASNSNTERTAGIPDAGDLEDPRDLGDQLPEDPDVEQARAAVETYFVARLYASERDFVVERVKRIHNTLGLSSRRVGACIRSLRQRDDARVTLERWTSSASSGAWEARLADESEDDDDGRGLRADGGRQLHAHDCPEWPDTATVSVPAGERCEACGWLAPEGDDDGPDQPLAADGGPGHVSGINSIVRKQYRTAAENGNLPDGMEAPDGGDA